MAERAPAFQFYPQDWLACDKVAEMTLEEEGVYIRLLCYCWTVGSIPADPERCARLAGKGCSAQTATSVQRAFNACSTDPQRLVHKRLEKERTKQAERREQQSEAGKRSAAARKKASDGVDSTTSTATSVEHPLNERSTSVQRKGNSSSSSSSSSSEIEEATASSCPQASQPADRTGDPKPREPKPRKPKPLQQPCTIEEAFCTVPVIGHEEQWRLPRAKLQEWQATFPGVNVEQATCEAVQWLIDNPSKRKTPKGILRFFNLWLSKEQDCGPRQLFRTNHTATQDRAITREQQQHAVFAHLNTIAFQQQARLTHDAAGSG